MTAASIIAVADGITHAGLWWQLFKFLVPNSFWGWELTIVRLGVTIASWAIGVGLAITGARIALLAGSIALILAEDPDGAAREATHILAHAERLAAPA